MSRGVGCRHGSDPELLWPWHRSAAVAPILPLDWKLPYAVCVCVGAALKRKKKNQKFLIREMGMIIPNPWNSS